MSNTKPIGIGPYLVACAAMLLLGLCVVAGAVVYALPRLGPAVVPVKPSANLAALVPDAAARGQLAAFYGDWSAVLRSETKPLRTTGQWRDAYRASVKHYQAASKLPSVKALDEPVSDRITATIGKADAALDGEPPVRESLASVLASIAEDLR
jgi:hypothetical protein